MKKNSIFHADTIMDGMLLIPATLQALLPFSREESFNISLLGYDFFIFLLLGFIPLLYRTLFSRWSKKTEYNVVLIVCLSFVISLRHINDFYFAHAAIGIEFMIGYLFAKHISYSMVTLRLIYYVTLIVFALLSVQQLSFSLGLGWFSSGQEDIELVDGVFRVGTTAGGSTFTGIFLVLLVGILIAIEKERIFQYFFLLIGLFSIIMTGTRSAIIVMVLIGGFMLLYSKQKKSSFIYKVIGLSIFIIYLLPTLQSIVDARNEAAGEDITSGRQERWEHTFQYMKDNDTFIFGNGGGGVPISNYNKNVKTFASPHNGYIGVFFEFGFIGIALLFVFLTKKVKKMIGHYSVGFVAFVGSLLVCWNTEVVVLSFLYSFYFWLLYFVEINSNDSYHHEISYKH